MKKLVLALILAAFIAPSAFAAATGTATFTVTVTQFAVIEGLNGGSTIVTGEAAYNNQGQFLFTEDFSVSANGPYNLGVSCSDFGAIPATICLGSASGLPAGVHVPQALIVGGAADAATLAGDYSSTVTVTVSML